MKKGILHNGIIERIEYPFVFVRIVQQSACSGCDAKSHCTVSEHKVKTIQIEDHSGKYEVNEAVYLCGELKTGLRAVWITFIVPLLLMVISLIIGNAFVANEITGGLAGLLILLPYYAFIYLIRDKLKQRFTFTLSKII
ncbi:MAG: SoxR reducing system RseC family protein [Tannerella sp.]|jgi:sigma-E factor negative regulatory protein RseC|nr:SoxR reducing system RseC family protein [Tannerella sp.]